MRGSAGSRASGAGFPFGRSPASSSARGWLRLRYASTGNSGARIRAHSRGLYSGRRRAADLEEVPRLPAVTCAAVGPQSGEEKGAIPRRLNAIRCRQEGEENPGSAIQQAGLVDPRAAGLPVSIAQQAVGLVSRQQRVGEVGRRVGKDVKRRVIGKAQGDLQEASHTVTEG